MTEFKRFTLLDDIPQELEYTVTQKEPSPEEVALETYRKSNESLKQQIREMNEKHNDALIQLLTERKRIITSGEYSTDYMNGFLDAVKFIIKLPEL